ncbi:MAG TPA: UDP-glucose 4-epimerase GalE [Bacilli bacterium]|nr:UDP-glucose 4-epimerase GalE [Bacilli bacterium]
MKVLVTGGTGFIGSHTCVELINSGHEVVIIDNLVNSKIEVLDKIKMITGVKPAFYLVDMVDKNALRKVFKADKFDSVIHFAGLKAVGESVFKPLEYYRNNLDSTLSLLELMLEFGVKNIVFSSSATVYGEPEHMPLNESDKIGGTTNPYGTTKLVIEYILRDFAFANPDFKAIALRYFNPVGAHPSGLIGEDPQGTPNNLMPYISKVAAGKLAKLSIYGDDYKTVDGTGVRDYIHVVDLAIGHVLALENIAKIKGYEAINLGTGKGTSVLQLVHAYEEANHLKINYEIKARRAGDVDENFADVSKAKKLLGFSAKYSIKEACKHAFEYEKHNQ